MKTKARQLGIGLALILVAVFGLLVSRSGPQQAAPASQAVGNASTLKAAAPAAPSGASKASAALQGSQPADKTYPNGVRVITELKHDISPPLRDIPPVPAQVNKQENDNPNPFKVSTAHLKDPVVQNFFGPIAMPTPLLTFEGISYTTSGCGCYPPDTNGDVGPNNYVQTVNAAFEIWDKSGNVLQTARTINTLFSGFGGACQTQNSGDPVVLYDQMADRWLISQFTSSTPYEQCIAISQTGDPTGAYYRYAFLESATNLYDYPKLGVWPDGYYMSANVYNGSTLSFIRPTAMVFDRTSMLQGLTATAQEFNPGNYYFALLPSDLDGSTPPPVGEPNFFATVSGNLTNIHLWKFHVDFGTPANSTFTGPTNIAAAPWDPDLCGLARNCIPQPGVSTAAYLDSLGDHTMFRLAYRNMGDHEVLLTNESVDSDGTDHAGVRWYELRDPNGSPFIYQQGTYAPDSDNRWMGSIAMDGSGDIAVGYSVSSSATYPSIRYAGRVPSDPLGVLGQGEATLFAGTGSQTGTGDRWGDYSNMSIDPSDDCTFWYTNEYYATTVSVGWHTRVGSFKFPGCGATTPTPVATGTPPTPTNTAVPTNTPSPLPTSCANYAVAAGVGTIVPGTDLVGVRCDDCAKPITLPFAVQLYDQSYTSGYVSSNGVLEFGSSDYAFGNSPLPASVYNHTIAGFWDDLLTNGSGQGVYSATTGTAPNRTFYLEWRASDLGAAGTPPVNFEIVLHENSNNFEVVYGTQTGGNGISATTGVQRDQQYFTQYSYNQAIITPGLMLSYTKDVCPSSTPTTVPSDTATATNSPVATDTPGGPTPTACTLTFTDVPPSQTFYQWIRCLACLGIINGYPDGTFRPNNNVTRGQLSKIASNSAGFTDTPTGQQFQDVPPTGPGSTFYPYIYRLVIRGYINGYPCGGPGEPCIPPNNLPYFRPNTPVTRGQITKIISNAAGFSDPPSGQQFQDVPVGSTFYTYTYRLVTRGVMSGYPCGSPPAGPCIPPDNLPYFRPNNNATRGQTSKIDANTFFPDCNPREGVKQ